MNWNGGIATSAKLRSKDHKFRIKVDANSSIGLVHLTIEVAS